MSEGRYRSAVFSIKTITFLPKRLPAEIFCQSMYTSRYVHKIIRAYLAACGLSKTYRCTRVIFKEDLHCNGHKAYGWIKWTSKNTFMLGLHKSMDDDMLRRTIGHEIGHLMTTEIIGHEGQSRRQWEELTCDVIGDLLARTTTEI